MKSQVDQALEDIIAYRNFVSSRDFYPFNRAITDPDLSVDLIEGPIDFHRRLESFIEELSSKADSPKRREALAAGVELKLELDEFIKLLTPEVAALNKIANLATALYSTVGYNDYLRSPELEVMELIDSRVSLLKAIANVREYFDWLTLMSNSPELADALVELDVLDLMATMTENRR